VGNNFDLAKSKELEISVSGNLIPYKIDSLEPGSYTVAALTDLNNNSDLDNGEPFGFKKDVVVQAGKETANIVVALQNLKISSTGLSLGDPLQARLAGTLKPVLVAK
jgi:uncharacterized protein (DUF2141 family)